MKKATQLKVLFVTSEAHPLVKTGGLADVSGSLPAALDALRVSSTSTRSKRARRTRALDIRVILPAYRQALRLAGKLTPVAWLHGTGAAGPVRILEGQFPNSPVKLWLVDAPDYFDRDGGPYADASGNDWPDNPLRYAIFARAVTELALDQIGLGWRADIVHCNDWQTGLVPALLAQHGARPATLFTIHNLAYQGVYPRATFEALGLPEHLWSMHALEYHGNVAYIKGGLAFADWLTTVSPTYAEEICTPEFGFGLDGLLARRSQRLIGILNGVDYAVWDPARDPLITQRYSARNWALKAQNKAALQDRLQLPQAAETPLLAFVGRLVWQKGIDFLLDALPKLLTRRLQLVILGSGEKHLESAFGAAARAHPDRLAVEIGYNEALAHQIEASADMFLMPSRYEPCGLNQIYSLRYGTVPIVRRTGGLADTVVDVSDQQHRSTTGFSFDGNSASALVEAIERALAYYAQPAQWQELALRGMKQDFSWEASAQQYLALYRRATGLAD